MNMVSSPVVTELNNISYDFCMNSKSQHYARVAGVVRKSHPSIQVDVPHGFLPRVVPSTGSTVELGDEPLDDPSLELRAVTWARRSSGWVLDLSRIYIYYRSMGQNDKVKNYPMEF